MDVKVSATQNVLEDVYFFNPEGGRTASQSLIGITSGEVSVTKNFSIEIVDSYYDVTINKKDSISLESMPVVKFKISNTKDFSDLVYEGVTDENGALVFKDLVSGTWYLKEVETIDGYKKMGVKKLIIKNKDVTIELLNEPIEESEKVVYNPETYDGILNYFVVLVVCLIGFVTLVMKENVIFSQKFE